MNEILQQQPRPQFLHFWLSRLVQIGKLILPAKRNEKLRLRDQTSAGESRAAAIQVQRGEIDVSRQILFARQIEQIFAYPVVAIGQQRAAIVIFVIQRAGFVSVVDGQDK